MESARVPAALGRQTSRPERSRIGSATDGVTPLEMMLKTTRRHYDAGRWDQAAMIARDAPPYVHARLATTTVKGDAAAPLRLEQTMKLLDERKPVKSFLEEWTALHSGGRQRQDDGAAHAR